MINYTLKQLYSFEAVVRLGGFTSASKELHITQPAVYMQVQQLQKNIGAKLFNINGKKITPTFIGKKIYETAVKAINGFFIKALEINGMFLGGSPIITKSAFLFFRLSNNAWRLVTSI